MTGPVWERVDETQLPEFVERHVAHCLDILRPQIENDPDFSARDVERFLARARALLTEHTWGQVLKGIDPHPVQQ